MAQVIWNQPTASSTTARVKGWTCRFDPKPIALAPYFSQEDSVDSEVFLAVLEQPSSEDLDPTRELTAALPDATFKGDERG